MICGFKIFNKPAQWLTPVILATQEADTLEAEIRRMNWKDSSLLNSFWLIDSLAPLTGVRSGALPDPSL
jgi:hypothetical protein